MPRRRNVLSAACLVIPLVAASAADDVPRYPPEVFFDTTAVFGASFSPDESAILVTSDESGVFNVHAVPTAGGAIAQLTRSEGDAHFAVGYFPDDDRFIYSADRGGNELDHLYVREIDGTVVDLTPGDGLKSSFLGWSGDDAAFFVGTNERDARYFDVYRYMTDGYACERVYENRGGMSPIDVSRDSRRVLLQKTLTNADDDLYLFDVTAPGDEPARITPHEGNVSHGAATFHPDSGSVWYTSDEGSEFAQLWRYDIATRERSLQESADWDIMFVSFSRDGRYRVTGINADARTRIRVVDTTSGRPLELPDVPAGAIAGVTFSDSGTRMAYYVNGDTAPSNLYVHDLEDGSSRRLTDTLSPGVDEAHLVSGDVVRYPSFDGLAIPALLYKPHGASPTRRAPALVWVHGGPGGQTRFGYSEVRQLLLNHGYAILAVNNRGSSGYGKTFFHLDDKRHGDVDLQDCVNGRTYLESLDWIDRDRIGIIGGSYGGYMVCAALAFAPDTFEMGIDIFGVTNWVRTLESIPAWWADFRESLYDEMGDPATDAERLRRISPLFHADRIRRPLLVVQGANDPRVLKVESDEMVEAVRMNGVKVEYVVFDDEGHGFTSKRNRIEAAATYLDFLDRYLHPATDARRTP